MTAILAPVTLADVERRAIIGTGAHAAALGACDVLEAMGRHLEAAAGRARVGANMAALVADARRRSYSDAVAAWEASPNPATREAVNAADDDMDRLAALSSGMR